MSNRPLWPTQERGIAETKAAVARGVRRICLTSPTGGGKSVMMGELAAWAVAQGWRVVLYVNRKALIEQITRTLDEHGIEHGIRAAGHQDNRQLPVQLSSLQTEHARAYKREEHKRWALHRARLVIVDEYHMAKGPVAQRILADHIQAGAQVVGVTATPIDMAAAADVLIVAGTKDDLRRCEALVRCRHVAPDEPDFRRFKKIGILGGVSEPNARKIMDPKRVFANVFGWFQKLNPGHGRAILFGPGVEESRFYAETFHKKGIPAAHVDGDYVWMDGKYYEADRSAREAVRDGSQSGDIRIVCNRFVLREGIDWPWLEHGILATVFDSLSSYMQAGGRLLRACPDTGKRIAVIQDHGGHYWRFGSLNNDPAWELGDTETSILGVRSDRIREKIEKEPRRCQACATVMLGRVCGECGWEADRSPRSRVVVHSDGELREVEGDIFKPHFTARRHDTESKWRACYFRALHAKFRVVEGAGGGVIMTGGELRKLAAKHGADAERMKARGPAAEDEAAAVLTAKGMEVEITDHGRTFAAAAGVFARENHYHPPRDLPLMPLREQDWWKHVRSVPRDRLRSTSEETSHA